VLNNTWALSATHCILRPRLQGSSWNWVHALGAMNCKHGATASRKKFDDISIRVDTINQRDGLTDRHRTTANTALTHSVAR